MGEKGRRIGIGKGGRRKERIGNGNGGGGGRIGKGEREGGIPKIGEIGWENCRAILKLLL